MKAKTTIQQEEELSEELANIPVFMTKVMVGKNKKTEKLMHGGKLKDRWVMRKVSPFCYVFKNVQEKLSLISNVQGTSPGTRDVVSYTTSVFIWLFSDRKNKKPKYRSPEVFCKKGVLRNFTKFTGKHLCQSLFFKTAALLKKGLWHRCFPLNFVKFLRTPFFIEHFWWLVLKI